MVTTSAETPSGAPASRNYSGSVTNIGFNLNRQTLQEQVLEALRSAITSGELRPGTELSENDLATRFGVSRGTLREAFRILQQSRLVESDSRGRKRVYQASAREISELFALRGALEGLAVRAIIERDDRQHCAALLRQALPPETLVDDFATHANLDLAFHEKLCELSGNQTLLESWSALEDRMRMIFFAANEPAPVPIMTRSHHEPIVTAIETGDAQSAVKIVAEHMNSASRTWAPDVPVLPPL